MMVVDPVSAWILCPPRSSVREEVEMISMLFIPVLVLVVYLVVRGSHTDTPRPAGDHGPVPLAPRTTGVVDGLERWRSAGLLGDDQVEAILAHERTHRPLPPPSVVAAEPVSPASRRQLPDVSEALGYLGGILALVGMSLLVGRYWSDIALAGRLGLSGGLAVALFGVGLLVPEDREPALRRMRWFLWLVSSAATGVFGGVLAHEVTDGEAVLVAFAVAVAVAVHDVGLWWRRDRPLQQLAFLAAVAVAVGTGVAELTSSGPAGIAVWVVGAVGVGLGLGHLTRLPPLTVLVGAVAVVVGGMVVAESWQAVSLLVSTATAFGLVALAAVRRVPTEPVEQRLLAVVGGVALVSSVPGTIGYFAERAGLVTGLVVWVVGGLLVFVGGRSWVRLPIVATVLGAVGLVGGAALTGIELERVAPLFGVVTALGLIGLGVALDRFALSVVGSIGLLVHVPWAILEWFPGEGRAPLLIMVSGGLIIAIAALLTRTRGRWSHVDGRPGTPPHPVS
jgi:hypothetical protein